MSRNKNIGIIALLLTSIALGLLNCSDGNNGEPAPVDTSTYNQCLDEYYSELTSCTEISCSGCIDWECLSCGSECYYPAELAYKSCCQIHDCPGYISYHSVSGWVKAEDGTGVPDVLMSLLGAGSQTTDTDGYYKIEYIYDGSHTLTPSKSGFCFNPENLSFSVLWSFPEGGSEYNNYNFTALQTCSSISGTITSQDGSPLPGISVQLSGDASASTDTASNGNYVFTDLYNGSYTVTPSQFGSTPLSRSVTVEISDATGQDFVITGRAISGRIVSAEGIAVSGVSVTLSGASEASTTTGPAGYYAFPGLHSSGSYTITPSSDCTAYAFDPSFITVDLLDVDIADQDFVVSVAPLNLTGSITAYGIPLSGVTVTRTGTGTTSTVTDAEGLFSFIGIQGELYYTITPVSSDYNFIPPNREITACNPAVSVPQFSGVKTWYQGIYLYSSTIDVTSDGGYIVAGDVNPYIAVLKLDGNGHIAWKKNYEIGAGNPYIQQTSDGGYIIAGSNAWAIAWAMKLDNEGNVAWKKNYGNSWTTSIQEESDGNYIMTGYTADEADFWVQKLDSNGNVLWQKTYGGGADDYAYSIDVTSDGGYVVAGKTNSFGTGSDAWVLKLDSNGNVLWQKSYGGAFTDNANSIQETSDGGYILAGTFRAGSYDAWVLKLDSDGNILWQKTYGGGADDYANSIRETSDGGYILVGDTASFGAGLYDAWVLKLESSGNVLWQKTYGNAGRDFAKSIQEISDGGYVISGSHYTGSVAQVRIFRTDQNGNIDFCGMVGSSAAITSNTNVTPAESTATVIATPATVTDISVVPQDAFSTTTQICPSM